ncbi:hypothetical protein AB0M28_12765 [Streptomyces sp. NPDC051940]|uniref:hypothetical protein n=1 Tax=Streptomyces sp. NPDC051940 TaxID=3155675 RepID=UPI00342E5AA1
MKTRKILGATLLGAAFVAGAAGSANAADEPGGLPPVDGLTGLGSGVSVPDGLLNQTGKLNGVGHGTVGNVAGTDLGGLTSLGGSAVGDGSVGKPSLAVDGVTEQLGGLAG